VYAILILSNIYIGLMGLDYIVLFIYAENKNFGIVCIKFHT